MKKVLVSCVVLGWVAMALMGAAPAPHNYTSVQAVDTVTYANPLTGTMKTLDSLIVVASDSANVILCFSGNAVINPGHSVYLSFNNGTAIDTIQVSAPVRTTGGMTRVPFSFCRGKSNNGALTDTVYIKAATGGSAVDDVVYFEDVCLSASVTDQ